VTATMAINFQGLSCTHSSVVRKTSLVLFAYVSWTFSYASENPL